MPDAFDTIWTDRGGVCFSILSSSDLIQIVRRRIPRPPRKETRDLQATIGMLSGQPTAAHHYRRLARSRKLSAKRLTMQEPLTFRYMGAPLIGSIDAPIQRAIIPVDGASREG